MQLFRSFDEITDRIQQRFNETGQVTLVTLTESAFRARRKHGDPLNRDDAVDYQSKEINRMRPRLCRLDFHTDEQDYGLSLYHQKLLLVERVQRGSSAASFNIQTGNVVLELNGQNTKDMSMNELKDIMRRSKENRQLEILVIDIDHYKSLAKLGIPVNSLSPSIQTPKERGKPTNHVEKFAFDLLSTLATVTPRHTSHDAVDL